MSNNLYDERIHCIPGQCPTVPMWIPGRPPYEHPGGCCPDAPVVNPYNPGVPNPVPTRYFYPVPPCGPWPHHPEEFFVLKRQLNEILKNIAKADISKAQAVEAVFAENPTAYDEYMATRYGS